MNAGSLARSAMLVVLTLAWPGAAPGQSSPAVTTGTYEARVGVTAMGGGFPRRDAAEIRVRGFFSLDAEPVPWAAVQIAGRADALVADRGARITAGTGRIDEAWVEFRAERASVRAGVGRLAWGRLDEVAPTDVINPVDTASFLLEGRTEARLAVPFVRARAYAGERLTAEAVLVPLFRRGRFDMLDERTSPFNLASDVVRPAGTVAPEITQVTPDRSWSSMSGGGRIQLTLGRADVGVSAYRGWEAFGPVLFEFLQVPGPAVLGRLVEYHPRFTMVGADFETATGRWAWRGEMAVRTQRTFAGASASQLVVGRSVEAGVGFDRTWGEARIYGAVLGRRDWSPLDPTVERGDVNFVGSIERSFAAGRYRARVFAVTNPADASAFVRGLFVWSLNDLTSVDVSTGTFLGSSDDAVGRFEKRDFVFAGLRWEKGF